MGSSIDEDGFRPNVGIIIANRDGKVFWGKRIQQNAWQFPQGGMNDDETPEETLIREIHEEVGLSEHDFRILRKTRDWLYYRLPKRYIRQNQVPMCIGQKQIWFMVELMSDDSAINLAATNSPEFDGWMWVSYWYPVNQVVNFKRKVYQRALRELAPVLPDY